MKKMLSKKNIYLLSIIVILLTLTIFFLRNKKINILSNKVSNIKYNEDLELDNWEISTVFYDSTVDNGNTPLTEIDWDASNLSFDEEESRTITLQMNYKNTNCNKDYLPGDVTITFTNLAYKMINDSRESNLQLSVEILAGVNDSTHTGYDWALVPYKYKHVSNGSIKIITYNDITVWGKEIELKNDIEFFNGTNVEGSIQIQYQITSNKEDDLEVSTFDYSSLKTLRYSASNFEGFLDSCTHELNKDIIAKLNYPSNLPTENDEISSNSMNFHYKRIYEHPWERRAYNIAKTAKKVYSLDGLPNANEYIWVKYNFAITPNSYYDYYPYIPAYYYRISDTIPEGCVVLDEKTLNTLTPENGNEYVFEITNSDRNKNEYDIIVGYPKEVYNEESGTTNISNSANLNVKFVDRDYFEFQDNSTINIDLSEFVFTYSGQSFKIDKHVYYRGQASYNTLVYDCIVGELPEFSGATARKSWQLRPSVMYTGRPMDIKFGDDIQFYRYNNRYRKLEESEYSIKKVTAPTIYDGNQNAVVYDIEIWVRYAGESTYSLHDTIRPGRSAEFEEDNIAGVYFLLKNVTTSVYISQEYKDRDWATFLVDIKYHTENIFETGEIYNFDYLEVYIDGELQNEATIDSYNNIYATTNMAQYDIDTYGHYLQRGYTYSDYRKFTLEEIKITSKALKEAKGDIIQNAVDEKFEMTYKIGAQFAGSYYYKELEDYYSRDTMLSNFSLYDLVPEGLFVTSTKEEIKNSISYRFPTDTYTKYWVYDREFKQLTAAEIQEIISENVTVEITKNYKNTGKTLIKISSSFVDNPLFIVKRETWQSSLIETYWEYNVDVPYDSLIEYGTSYTNEAYLEANEPLLYSHAKEDIYDLNDNADITEKISKESISRTIMSIVDSHQDLQISAQTDDSGYDTKKITTDYSGYYEYKLRARTAQNEIENLIIYDSLENYAKDSEQNFINSYGVKGHWQGEFLGVDTSYPESKGYNIKVYYSNNPQPGNLSEDNSWQEYNDNVDKTQVKSLAFEYLDENNQPAILPANSLTYIIIRMKAPSNHYKTFAYNGCWTEWNAIDPATNEPIDFVTGINSNIVKVGLPSSVEPEDMELTLTKKWQDNSNSLSKRPENVTFQIIANNNYSTAQEITFSGTGNTWTKTIEVPKYDDNGEEITYTISEETINLEENYRYIPYVNNYEVTNTLYKNIVITKKWLDNNNAYLTRPSNITVKVYQNGTYYKDLNITGNYSTNTWAGSLSVPAFDNNGNEYNYTVDEISVNNYSTTCENLVCTNTLTGEENLTISKIWNDNNNQYNTRPASISIKLKQNGSDYQNINLNGDSNTWNSSTITVPKYDSNGVKYNYTIEETPAEHYGLLEYNQDSYTVSNSLKENVNLTITKKWLDNDNEYNTRPQELKITLLQNNNEYQEITLTGDSNTWSTTIEVPKYDNDQKLYKYTIKEVTDNLEDYQDISYSEEELEVINKLKKNDKLLLTKRWLDHDNEYKTRPEKITIQLLQNGEVYQEVELSGDSNTWEKEIEIPVYDDNSTRYIYTIKELEPIDKYEKITIDQTTLTITNELTEVPTVTVYFTVLNGYILPGTNEIRYDEEGFREMLRQHNIDPDQEYAFTFLLENIETNKTYEGRLSTKGVLEFEDIPYGDYKAIEGEDDFFEFVSMKSISNVMGVTFTPSANGGIISIRPTGQNIIYGANIINKIAAPIPNPNTKSGIKILIIILMITGIMTLLLHFNKFPKKITS